MPTAKLDTSPISVNVFRNVFDALTRIEADGSVSPLLAVSWSASEDTKTWEFVIPSAIAYGQRTDRAPIPPGSTLLFEIELIAIPPAEAAG